VAAKDHSRSAQLQQLQQQSRSGDAAYNITEECERLFCETLRTAFLVEKNAGAARNSLVMGALEQGRTDESAADMLSETPPYDHHGGHAVGMPVQMHQHRQRKPSLPTPAPSPGTLAYAPAQSGEVIKEYLEVYDYHSTGTRFRGFVAEKRERALFVFFDREVMEQDLKPGLTSLLELAGTDGIDCDQLIVCLDRTAEGCKDLAKDLGWVGFEIAMLDAWSGHECTLSDRWLFLSMDV